MRAVVFLVHGTFAGQANWVQVGSRFRKKFHARVPGVQCAEPILWSGNNTTAARAQGIKKLSNVLRESLDRNHTAPHFVIGHSHGGLIALQTVAMEKLWPRVGVICLSTPFLHPRQRRVTTENKVAAVAGGLFASAVMAALAVVMAALAASLLALLFAPRDPGLSSATEVLAIWSPRLIAVIFLLIPVAIFTLAYFLFRASKNAKKFVQQNQFSGVPPDQVLLIAEEADEAQAFLSTFQFFAWLINKAVTAFEVMISAMELWLKRSQQQRLSLRTLFSSVVAFASAIALVMLVCYAFKDDLHLSLDRLKWAVFVGILVFSVSMLRKRKLVLGSAKLLYRILSFSFTMVSSPFLFILWLTSALLFWPMRDMILCSLLLDISVQAVPPGEWTLHHFEPNRRYMRGWALAHSAAYDDARVTQLISKWIEARISQSTQKGSAA